MKNDSTSCTFHCNYFDLIGNTFQRCSLQDQIAIFRFVDRFVSTNHVIYLLIRETITNNARLPSFNRQNSRWSIVSKRNLVVVQDGIQQYDDALLQTLNESFDEIKSTTRRILVKCSRDYGIVAQNLLPGMRPTTNRIEQDEENYVKVNKKVKLIKPRYTRNLYDYADDDEDEENTDTYHDIDRYNENSNDLFPLTDDEQEVLSFDSYHRKRGRTRIRLDRSEEDESDKENQPPNKTRSLKKRTTTAQRTSVKLQRVSMNPDEDDTDRDDDEQSNQQSNRDKERNTRNCQKLFSKSSKSVRAYYELIRKTMDLYNEHCRNESVIVDSHTRRVKHEYINGLSNNATITFSMPATHRNEAMPLTNESTRWSICHHRTSIFDEQQITDANCVAVVNENVNIDLSYEARHEEQLNREMTILERRLNSIRKNIGELIEQSTNERSVEETDIRFDASSMRKDEEERSTRTDDEKMLRYLADTAHTSGMGSQEYRVKYNREFSLDKLRRVTDIVQRLAINRIYNLYDFVFYSEYDAWNTFNRVLDYGIRVHQLHEYFPIKHALWDVVVVDNTNTFRNKPTHEKVSMDNYDLVWVHHPSLVIGDLVEFIQSFKQFIRSCVTTCTCYFLNQKVINTRRTAPKHDCVLPKASQGAYYALFLRMNIGHELLCTSTIKTREDAVHWLRRYETLNEHMWKKRRIPKSKLFESFLQRLEDTTTGSTFADPTRPIVSSPHNFVQREQEFSDNESFLDYNFDDD